MTIRKIKNRFNIIRNEVSELVGDKYYFEKYKEYIKQSKNIDKQNDFLFFIAKNYQILSLINVCKQVDKRDDVASLINLLKAIKDNKNLFTLKWYKRQWKPVPIMGKNKKFSRSKEAAKYFEEFAVKDNSMISCEKINKDIQRIKKAIKGERFGKKRQSIASLTKYRHKRGVHYAIRSPKVNVPVKNLYEAVDLLENMVLKYGKLLDQTGMNTLLPGNIGDFLEFNKIFKD